MTIADAITAVRSGTAHDADTQVTDAQLLARLTTEYQRLRRWLATFAPNLCEAVLVVTVDEGDSSIPKSSLVDKDDFPFERLVRIERQRGDDSYYPLQVSDSLNAFQAQSLSVYEQSDSLVISPASGAPGAYRVSFLTGVGAVTEETVINLPEGLEDVVIERTSAWVRQRHNEDPSYHMRTADAILAEQRPLLRRRYGVHPVSAINITRW